MNKSASSSGTIPPLNWYETLVCKNIDGTTYVYDETGKVASGIDDGALLQMAVDNGDGSVFVSKPRDGSHYRLEDPLILSGERWGLHFELGTAVRAASDFSGDAVVKFNETEKSKRIDVDGPYVHGNNVATYGIDMAACQHCVISNVRIRWVGCGIRFRDVEGVHGSFWNGIHEPEIRLGVNAPSPAITGRHAGILCEYTGGNEPNQNYVVGGFVATATDGGAGLHMYGSVHCFTVFGTEFASDDAADNQIGVLTEQQEEGHTTQFLQMFGGRIEFPVGAEGTYGFRNINTDGEAGRFVLFPAQIQGTDTNYDFSDNVFHWILWDANPAEMHMNTDVHLSEGRYANTWIDGTKQ